MDDLTSYLTMTESLGLFFLGAGCLAVCLRGYAMVRTLLFVLAVLTGAAAGVWLFGQIRHAAPAGADVLIVCGGLAAVMVLLCWMAFSVMLALYLALYATLGVASLGGWPASTDWWVLGAFAGATVLVLFVLYARPLVVCATAAAGAWGAVYAFAACLAGGFDALDGLLAGPDRRVGVLAAVILAVMAVAAGGIFTQLRLLPASPDKPTKPASPRTKTRPKTGRKPWPQTPPAAASAD